MSAPGLVGAVLMRVQTTLYVDVSHLLQHAASEDLELMATQGGGTSACAERAERATSAQNASLFA